MKKTMERKMNTYRTKDCLAVGAGSLLQLSTDQAKRRATKLEALGKDQYRAKEVVQFKKGETFGLEGELPKAHQHLVEKLSAAAAAVKMAGRKVAEAASDLLGKK
jgi:hypothetical protein